MKAAIVVPTARPASVLDFLTAWEQQFSGHDIIIIEDNPTRTLDLASRTTEHYSWKEIDQELQDNSWIIPRRTDCIRSFGFYKASQKSVDIVVSLDDDCFPTGDDFLLKHWERLSEPAHSPAWTSTLATAVPRGVPYFTTNRRAECVLNHGLWTNIPDYDALTQISITRYPFDPTPLYQVIPQGKYFPMCGMNIAFRPAIMPIMYFLLMGRDCPYDRFGDIWCGVIAKRICDHLGYAVRSGDPLVDHRRASNVWKNLMKEAPGYEMNELLWKEVDSAILTETSFSGCYRAIARQVALLGGYWAKAAAAMGMWADLVSSVERNSNVTDDQNLAQKGDCDLNKIQLTSFSHRPDVVPYR